MTGASRHGRATAATMVGGLPRWAIPLVLALIGGLLVPLVGTGVSEANGSASELQYACAQKKNGQMRAVDSLSDCRKREVAVTIKPGPVEVCVQPSGSVRLDSLISRCRPPAQRITLPPTSGTTYFCAAVSSGVLRYVSDPSECAADEMPYQVTPNDDAPTVVSTSPTDGATHIATNTDIEITFSEPVTAANGALSLTCDGNGVPAAVSGSPGATVTINPDSALSQGVTCDVTVSAGGITDVDTLDPPNNMASSYSFSFTTDAAPSVTSTTPANGATDVDPGSDIVVNFSEPVDVTGGSFTVTCGGSPADVSLLGSGTDSVSLTPSPNLRGGSACTVTVVAAQVSDSDAGDPPDGMAANYVFTFTTVDTAPSVASTSPVNGAVDVAPGSNIAITFSEPISVQSAAAFSVECVGQPLGFTIDTLQGSTITIYPASALPIGSECTVTVYASQVFDSDAVDPPDTMESNYTFSFTVDSNEAPTDIALSPSSIDEGNAIGDVVGTLSTTDADAGDTFVYSLVSGTGSDDNGSFTISGDKLKADAVFDHETQSSYSIRVKSQDALGASFEKVLTVTITDINEAPVAGNDSYTGAIGNTLAVVGTTGTGPHVVLTGEVLTADDTDPEGASVSAVAETVTTTGGGSATISANGSFTYLPGVGDKSQTDSFTYTVTDGTLTDTGIVEVTIGSDLVWYVDSAYVGGGSDGRSGRPLTSLSTLNGAGGAGDADASGETIFVYGGSALAGGLVLEANQQLIGQPYGLTIGGNALVAAGGVTPTLTNAAGNGIDLAGGVTVHGVTVTGATVDGIHGTSISTATVGSTVTVASSGQDGVDLSGAATGAVSIGATVSGSTSRSVNVSGRTGGTTTFSGSISGPGIVLSSNTGATVEFTGALSLSTTTTSAFSATGGGTVTATNTSSTLASTTGTTLDVSGVTIGASGLKFASISSNGAVNGIRLNSTGTSGGLSVLGGGNTALGGNASGGTIANSTGAGVSLTSTASVSLNNLSVTGTPNAPGIDGTGVAGFSFTNGTVTGSGATSKGSLDSNIAFNDADVANVTGAVTVSNSVLTNAYRHGVDIRNSGGSISALTVTNNSITSSTTFTDTNGSGIVVQARGTATTAAAISGGSITGNTVTNFPSGSGIVVSGGNDTAAGAPTATLGTVGAPINVDSNTVQGQSQAVPMVGNSIAVALVGRGSGVVNVRNNGTVATPLRYARSDGISVTADGAASLTSTVSNNVVAPQSQLSGENGIQALVRNLTLQDGSPASGATLNLTASNNGVSGTTGHGIDLTALDTGTLNSLLQNNNVQAPSGTSQYGVRIRSGDVLSSNAKVCVQMTSNTAFGSGGLPGIGLRKEGSVPTTHTFGIVGLSPSPATAAQASAYVAAQNLGSVGGAQVINGDNFVSCSLPFIA